MQELILSDTISRPKLKKSNQEQLRSFFRQIAAQHSLAQLTFVCIGTDRSTGDALGPIVGLELVRRGFSNVIGTLELPCDASNLKERIATISEDKLVVAIDACLGQPATVGYYLVGNQSLQPAQSVGKGLPAVGHYSVAAVVNEHGPKPYWTLQTTSLHTVMLMAQEISDAICAAFCAPLQS
ncbi:spore protease YyaC [Paenibacillus sp. UMB4589-SE434]|uniref:spore protease YyaC n=1 Tax=Paenibacillus sp. UMB4589-SE434 TaxID=3046314 RepID=UPI00254AF454|nr:spore protease YyaC [Paenibacillus sp. UMB4589-SE434]MDK8183176.1 spore protease YyaC [Paenibacillus sp. UMB4589-SE434]